MALPAGGLESAFAILICYKWESPKVAGEGYEFSPFGRVDCGRAGGGQSIHRIMSVKQWTCRNSFRSGHFGLTVGFALVGTSLVGFAERYDFASSYPGGCVTAMNWVSPDDQPYPTQVTISGATVVRATGRLNFPDVDRLRQQFSSLVDSGAVRMAIDLSGVEAIDSAGIGALISGLKAARNAGGDLRLVAPSKVVVDVLKMMNLDTLLTMHASSEDAFPREL